MGAQGDGLAPRERLVQVCLEIVRGLGAEGVLGAVGVREIARRAGVTTRTLYHHFGSLAGLADAVVERVYDPDPDPELGFVPVDLSNDAYKYGVNYIIYAMTH